MMFGPHDSESTHSNQSMAWKIKRHSNDDLRQKFINQTIPQIDFLGLKVPDPSLYWDKEKNNTILARLTGRNFIVS